MICQSPVRGFTLLVEHQIDEVKSGEESRRQLDVVDHGELRVVLGIDRVGCGQDSRSGIQGANNARFGN